MTDSPRKKAVTILMNVDKNDAYVNIEMNKLRSQNLYKSIDIRFIGQIVNGVIKNKIAIDYLISKYSKVRLNKISPFVLAVLRSGIYQIVYMDKVPDSAAVYESVKLIKKSSVSRLSSYVNAVLRAVNGSDLEKLDLTTPDGLSVFYSFPLWLVNRWIESFGIDFTKELLASLNKKPGLFVRRSVSVSSVEFEESLVSDGVAYECVKFSFAPDFNYCYNLGNIGDLKALSSYENSFFYIQDPAAAFAAFVLSPQKGETVIDMCAAPGGKSLFAAELMGNEGCVLSCDIYEHKLELIKSNCLKYGIDIIKPMLCDATVYNSNFEKLADKVLCDVPCSGFGIISKKPDIKYARKECDISALSELSIKILDNASKYVKIGGTLVFSTCTFEAAENEKVVEQFLSKHSEYSPFPFDGEEFYKTFYPNVHNTDGFFVCRLKRNA